MSADSIAALPTWLTAATVGFSAVLVALLLVGPRGPFDRAIELIRTWRTPARAEAATDHEAGNLPTVAPGPTGIPRRAVVVAAVLALAIPLLWRRRYRRLFVSELAEQSSSCALAYAVRVLVRIPAIRRALTFAEAEDAVRAG